MLLARSVVFVDRGLLSWWPSAGRPHWYKSPYELASTLDVATCVEAFVVGDRLKSTDGLY